MNIIYSTIGIVGSGAMGRGIAQLTAQAGSKVLLFDSNPEASEIAKLSVDKQWDQLFTKKILNKDQCDTYKSRLFCVKSLNDLSQCDLIIEAIIENLEEKVSLFQKLQSLGRSDLVLVSNTSSLSITKMAAQLTTPEQLLGLHFFNPVPLMKVVEVIEGLQSRPGLSTSLMTYVQQLGHHPVRCKDTPGFIVNHAGRGYGTEALRIVSEGVADFATIDLVLRDQVGFKLGPFELMDLTGLDISHPAMHSIYHQYNQEPRYRPSVITQQRFDAGLFGRKSSQGFYQYIEGKVVPIKELVTPIVSIIPPIWLSPRATRRQDLLQLIEKLGGKIESGISPSEEALILVAPLGFDVTTIAVVDRLDPTRTIGIDMLIDDQASRRRVLATTPATRTDIRDCAHALMTRDGKSVSVIRDSAGFISQRVIATIVNIASDICQQNICTPNDLEKAVQLGLGYPQGPLAMGNVLGPTNILEILFNMQTVYGDPRYRPSPWLRRRGAIGLSLLHEEL